MKENYKAGFCAICGKPNAGKSTLLNRLIRTKLAIVTDKPQTTRDQIVGIFTSNEVQIVFQDTPGIHIPRYKLQERMIHFIDFTLKNTDLILFITEADNYSSHLDYVALEKIKDIDKKKILVINKLDLNPDIEVDEVLTNKYKEAGFNECIKIAAIDGIGLDTLVEKITEHLPKSELLYNPDEIALQPMRFFMAEFVREKIFMLLGQEVPYSTAIEIISYKELPNKIVVSADIVVEKQSQKKILIGKDGSMITQIRKASESEGYKFTKKRVQYHLFVKVRNNWRKKDVFLDEFGYKKLK